MARAGGLDGQGRASHAEQHPVQACADLQPRLVRSRPCEPLPHDRQCHRRGRQVDLGADHLGLADDRLVRIPLGHRLRAHSGRGEADRHRRIRLGQPAGRRRAYARDAYPHHPRHRRHLPARPVHRRQGAARPARRGRPDAQDAQGPRHAAGDGPARRDGRSRQARRRMGTQERRACPARSLRRDLDLRPAADQQAADRHRGAAVGAAQDGLHRLSAPRPAAAHRRAARGARRSTARSSW